MPAFSRDLPDILASVWRLLDETDQTWRFTKKGDKRTAGDIEKSIESKKRFKAQRRKAATDRTLAAVRKRNLCRALPGQSIADRMLRAMQPGAWYGAGDITRMVGLDRSARAKVHQVLLRREWVEKAKNPAYEGNLHPWQIIRGAEPEPLHLYRLTELGLKVKAALPAK